MSTLLSVRHLGRRISSLHLMLGGVLGVLVVLNMGGCEFSYAGPSLYASSQFGYGEDQPIPILNGIVFPPSSTGNNLDVVVPVGVNLDGRLSVVRPVAPPASPGLYVGDGFYTDGVHGPNYYFSDAYYAGGFY